MLLCGLHFGARVTQAHEADFFCEVWISALQPEPKLYGLAAAPAADGGEIDGEHHQAKWDHPIAEDWKEAENASNDHDHTQSNPEERIYGDTDFHTNKLDVRHGQLARLT